MLFLFIYEFLSRFLLPFEGPGEYYGGLLTQSGAPPAIKAANVTFCPGVYDQTFAMLAFLRKRMIS